jgi:uncharacterized protein (TIGR02145 family)
MSLKKTFGRNVAAGLVAAGAALCMCAFSACSNGAETPSGTDGDMSAVEAAEETVESAAEEAAGEPAEEGSAEVAKSPALEPGEGEPESSSSIESSASLDSILAILFPDGIDIDTARRDPDSVGVWHFYDPRGTHDNPDFVYGEMTDPRDGMVYKTTTIGGQVWMAENLNYFDIEGASSSIKNDWCYWDKPENCESAGRLYTWKVAQRICPEGWRLPSNEDWTALLTAVGADSLNEILWKGSSKLKSMSGWENDGSGTDDFGFTVLPAGKKFFTKVQDGFTGHGCSALMWASTEAEGGAADSLAFRMELDCSNDNVTINTAKKYDGLSVRCVKE